MLKGEKLILRPVEVDDLELLWKWFNDPETMPFYDNVFSRSGEESNTHFKRWTGDGVDQRSAAYIVQLYEGTSIGFISLQQIDWKNRWASLFINVGEKEFRRKGNGAEAINLLTDHAFQNLNLHRIHVEIAGFNLGAINLFKRCGFTVEGELREKIYMFGRYHNAVVMSLLSREKLL